MLESAPDAEEGELELSFHREKEDLLSASFCERLAELSKELERLLEEGEDLVELAEELPEEEPEPGEE